MKDVQSELDNRGIYLHGVGVSDLEYPIIFNGNHTIGNFTLLVDLDENVRGTHMSRFVEVLNRFYNDLSEERLLEMSRELRKVLEAKKSYIKVSFPYFSLRKAPITKMESYTKCDITYEIINEEVRLYLAIPIITLCPCSKAISNYGAHNQRALVEIGLKLNRDIAIEEIANYVEKSSSGMVFSLLKREDEKYVTEHMYDNPHFVEDVVRDLSVFLENDKRIDGYKVKVVSYESIHSHNAFSEREGKSW
ncbi:GTP cyclohydrolase FolE2 [Marinitoga litoralis]|uniref:GTP cyclohydrolase FolE2 n=1 Tax=Marinitoga litoralis TaxID=570855 RepID=UPI0019611D86|nr:GTP cyclohydrolase FolE2 [Marinitoga litoralis]MBM7560082.1 GTP cyclohydrolase I [Marinitoga litoralis]